MKELPSLIVARQLHAKQSTDAWQTGEERINFSAIEINVVVKHTLFSLVYCMEAEIVPLLEAHYADFFRLAQCDLVRVDLKLRLIDCTKNLVTLQKLRPLATSHCEPAVTPLQSNIRSVLSAFYCDGQVVGNLKLRHFDGLSRETTSLYTILVQVNNQLDGRVLSLSNHVLVCYLYPIRTENSSSYK